MLVVTNYWRRVKCTGRILFMRYSTASFVSLYLFLEKSKCIIDAQLFLQPQPISHTEHKSSILEKKHRKCTYKVKLPYFRVIESWTRLRWSWHLMLCGHTLFLFTVCTYIIKCFSKTFLISHFTKTRLVGVRFFHAEWHGRKRKYGKKYLIQYHFDHHKSHMDWPEIKHGTSLWGRLLTAWAKALPGYWFCQYH